MKKYIYTILFKHFDTKPLIVQADTSLTSEYDPSRREAVYTINSYPAALIIACADVLAITCIENEKTSI